MTTIAYRDGVLAADTLVTENGRRVGHVQKIGKFGSVLWGVTGCLLHQVAFHDWLRGGLQGEPPGMKTPEGATSTVIVIADGRLLTFDEHGYDHMPMPDYHAIGSGAALALGAMSAGASAYRAVEAAMKLDVHSGGEITVLHR